MSRTLNCDKEKEERWIRQQGSLTEAQALELLDNFNGEAGINERTETYKKFLGIPNHRRVNEDYLKDHVVRSVSREYGVHPKRLVSELLYGNDWKDHYFDEEIQTYEIFNGR